jgi:hypothetical protein
MNKNKFKKDERKGKGTGTLCLTGQKFHEICWEKKENRLEEGKCREQHD